MTSDPTELEPRRATLFQCEELSTGGEAFARLPIRQRVLGWASGQKNAHVPACVFPQAVVIFYLAKSIVYVALYWYIIRDSNHAVFDELNVKRFILYNIIGDAIGLNATFGPLGFRSLRRAAFVPLFNFLTPGTITGPLLPEIRALRSRWLVAAYAIYLALLVRALVAPTIGAAEVLPPLVLLAVIAPFDFVIAEASRLEHYGYMLFCLAFDEWIFGCQCVQLALWTGAGISKLGPWFKAVPVSMAVNAPWSGLVPTFIRALHREFPRDVRPSALARALAAVGVAAEVSMGALCAFGPTRRFGVLLTLGFHTFISLHLPFASVQEWNLFCMYASVCFFGHYTFTWPDDGVHPALAAGLALVLLVVPLVGQLCPSRVPFLYAYRPYAGNWFFAWHIVSKNGQPKLRSLRTAESLFFEENDPESSLAAACRKHMPTAWLADREWHAQFVTVGLAAQLMQWPQYRPLLPIIEAMETRYGWTSADDYRLFFHMPFLALVHGWNLAAGYHLREGAPYYAALQQTCGFEKGECLVVLFKPLSLLSRTAEFCVIDPADAATHGGDGIMRGRIPYAEVERMQPVEMDVEMLETYVVTRGREKRE